LEALSAGTTTYLLWRSVKLSTTSLSLNIDLTLENMKQLSF